MEPITTVTARLDELESRLALQDQSILELSDEVYRQQQTIAKLEAAIGRLAEQLKGVTLPEPASDPTSEVPPHY